MSVVVTNKKGKRVTLLNPAEKGEKYAYELRTNIRTRNDGSFKPDKNGELGLTKTQRAYRSGYLAARKDSAACYKAKRK